MSTTVDKIRMAAAKKHISLSELARQIGTTPQNLNAKLKRSTFTEEELKSIAHVLGAEYVPIKFVFEDGTEI